MFILFRVKYNNISNEANDVRQQLYAYKTSQEKKV